MDWSKAWNLAVSDLNRVPQRVTSWLKSDAKYWGGAFAFMLAFLVCLDLAIGAPVVKKVFAQVEFFETQMEDVEEEPPIEHFAVGETPIDPPALNTESLTEPPTALDGGELANDAAGVLEGPGDQLGDAPSGSLNGLGVIDLSAAIGPGQGFRADAVGPGKNSGGPGPGSSLDGRDSAGRKVGIARDGGTKGTEQAVKSGLNWLARHQNPDGSWGCAKFQHHCKDPSCAVHHDEKGSDYPMAATAFGLLPFFASGQTHVSDGPYKHVIKKGLVWMTRTQDQKSGRLGDGSMYEHGLATIALCEAFGLSKDNQLKPAAQEAIRFCERAQNDSSGGWHYTANPPAPGDTSVVGWQLMALKSGQMAGLQVNPNTLAKAKGFLQSVAKGKSRGQFSYMPDTGPTPAMTAVGLLCNQYLGMKRNDPAMEEGKAFVMSHLNEVPRNAYFLYYATQVMHNLPGPDWDQWNRSIRRHLIESQIKEGCAAGSWDPKDKGHVAGRVMVTSVNTLTLEVYYRYLPLYQIDKKDE